jgi:hypothetical protein
MAWRLNCLDYLVVTSLLECVHSGLSAFQLEVAQLFFSLRASRGFLLAGGGVLLDGPAAVLITPR